MSILASVIMSKLHVRRLQFANITIENNVEKRYIEELMYFQGNIFFLIYIFFFSYIFFIYFIYFGINKLKKRKNTSNIFILKQCRDQFC